MIRYLNEIKLYIIAFAGSLLTGFAISVLLTPYKIVGGGVSGLSTIFYHTLNIPIGVSFFALNGLLILIGFKTLGKKFVIKTIFGVATVSVSMEIFSCISIPVENIMLITLFGGTLYGLGIGMTLASGATTGGTDILGRIIQKKLPHIPIGKLLIIIDGLIITISFVIFKNLELTMYGIISLFISSNAVDYIIGKLNLSVLVFAVTDKGDEIAEKLVNTSTRGVTMINAKGKYTNTDKNMLFCALKESEIESFQNKILETDSNAFIVFTDAKKIRGNGFRLYK